MKTSMSYSTWQLWSLVILRVAVGWHFLYEGVTKLINPNWSSLGSLMDSGGVFEGLFQSMAGNPAVLNVVDFLNIWGLMLIGAGLMIRSQHRLLQVDPGYEPTRVLTLGVGAPPMEQFQRDPHIFTRHYERVLEPVQNQQYASL